MKRHKLLTAVAALVLLGSFGAATEEDAGDAPAVQEDVGDVSTTQPDAGDAPAAEPDSPASALLATLAVKGRAPMTGYERARFGPAWLDADRNGCDTRNDVLGEHLTDPVFKAGTRDCVVTSGTLDDPYTGSVVDFVQGDGTLVDIDHVVALGNAWATGAFGWDIGRRAALANDPLNLLPVDASANRQKGDGDAATWLPPDKGFRCAYAARQVSVKAKYGLWVTPPEHAALDRVLAACPTQASVPDSGAPVHVDQHIVDPGPPVTTDPGTSVPGATVPGETVPGETVPGETVPGETVPGDKVPGSTVYLENCDAARAAGAAPVRRGDPAYGSHLDGDDDGIACE